MKRFMTYIANLKISSKIWLCMLTVAMILSLFLGLFSSWYFTKLYREDTYAQTANSLQIGSQALSDSYDLLLTNVIDFASTADFVSIVNDAHFNNTTNYGKNRALLQEPLATLTVSNPILDSIMIIGKNGEFYSQFTKTLKKDSTPASAFGWDLSSVQGISWLPLSPSPFMKNNDIIPVIIPIRLWRDSKYLQISENLEDADIMIVLMLDNQVISKRLTLAYSSNKEYTIYIADKQGNNINLPEDSPFYQTACSFDISNAIETNREPQSISLLSDTAEYSLYSKPLDFCDLSLVIIFPKTMLHQRISRMNTFIVFIAFIGLGITTFLSLALSRFVTRPFNRLIMNVKNIEANTYTTPYQMKYHDEIGQLNIAINSMYDTIQQQFEQVKQSERAKYRSEIQLLSEQINPHFLYNTLEGINMEVLSGHKESASSMINSLGDFLRIGLSYGNEVILIPKECSHVKAYIDIMNHRIQRKIDFTCSIAPELESHYILKSILQPIVENSIRHGFDVDMNSYENILLPTIMIQIYLQDNHIIIEVSDNGRGIDIEKATSSLYRNDHLQTSRQHVGLNNIYQRLSTYYTDVYIDFESIPFFQNTVRISLPYNN